MVVTVCLLIGLLLIHAFVFAPRFRQRCPWIDPIRHPWLAYRIALSWPDVRDKWPGALILILICAAFVWFYLAVGAVINALRVFGALFSVWFRWRR